jgi:hypothetical protein
MITGISHPPNSYQPVSSSSMVVPASLPAFQIRHTVTNLPASLPAFKVRHTVNNLPHLPARFFKNIF